MPAIVVDKVCGMAIAQAVLAALVHQGRTGEGQAVEVPMLETMVAFNLLEHQRGTVYEPPIGPFGYDRLLHPYRRPIPHGRRLGRASFRTTTHWLAFFRISPVGPTSPPTRASPTTTPASPTSTTCTGSLTRWRPTRTRPNGWSGVPGRGSRPCAVLDLAHA